MYFLAILYCVEITWIGGVYSVQKNPHEGMECGEGNHDPNVLYIISFASSNKLPNFKNETKYKK